MHLGNDVVDLTDPGAVGKCRDARFVARVFTPDEQAWIAAAAAPDRALWRLWAAKEAAYKAARKTVSGLVFAHRAFAVDPVLGRVVCANGAFAVQWTEAERWVHAIAVPEAERERTRRLLESLDTARFAPGGDTPASRRAALEEARAILRALREVFQ